MPSKMLTTATRGKRKPYRSGRPPIKKDVNQHRGRIKAKTSYSSKATPKKSFSIPSRWLKIGVWIVPLVVLYFVIAHGSIVAKTQPPKPSNNQDNNAQQTIDQVYKNWVDSPKADSLDPTDRSNRVVKRNSSSKEDTAKEGSSIKKEIVSNSRIQIREEIRASAVNEPNRSGTLDYQSLVDANPSTEVEKSVPSTARNRVATPDTDHTPKNEPSKETTSVVLRSQIESKIYLVHFSQTKATMIPILVSLDQKPTAEEALKQLFKGPTAKEKEKGFASSIPPGTKIRSIHIDGNECWIDLSGAFQKNRYSRNGVYLAIAQIVYTLCEFPTISKVHFLIDGQKAEFLGGDEGIINHPFTKKDFPKQIDL